jgi:hypothetical protein
MINSDPATADPETVDRETGAPTDTVVAPILRAGAPGAVWLAGIATAVVVAIWFAFYFLVFVPRAAMP